MDQWMNRTEIDRIKEGIIVKGIGLNERIQKFEEGEGSPLQWFIQHTFLNNIYKYVMLSIRLHWRNIGRVR